MTSRSTGITGVRTTLLSAEMPRPWVPSAPQLHVIRVEVDCSDGVTGIGFSWTPTIGRHAAQALLENDIAAFAVGRPADPAELWPELWAYLHEAGGGGLTTIAMAGVDIALWDAAGKRAGQSLADLLGRKRNSIGAYGSGVNLHYPEAELVAQVERWVAQGHTAVKVKVGKPDAREDLDRLTAVRAVLGPTRRLMIDANQRWDLRTAASALELFAPVDPYWIEEPLRSDDTRGYRALRGQTGLRVAMGENVHTIHRFRDLIDAGAADVYQPNVVRVGGITPFLEIARLITAADLVVAPHLLIDLSAQLALALDAETEVEDVEDADFGSLGLLASPSPVSVSNGVARVAATHPGIGLDFILPRVR